MKETILKIFNYRAVKWSLTVLIMSAIYLMLGLTVIDNIARTNEGIAWMWLGILGILIWCIPIAFVSGLIIDIVKSKQTKSVGGCHELRLDRRVRLR